VADLQDASTVQPVTLLAWNAPVTISQTALAGPDAAAFSIRGDECKGKTLAAGQSCRVFVRFEAPTAGTKAAGLQFVHGDGTVEVDLDGHARGGVTKFTMLSDSGDWIGGGQNRTYTPQNATISAGGSRRFVGMSVSGDDGSWWTAQFEPGGGDILAAGRTYANATRYPFNNDGNGMSISGSGRGCNTLEGSFTVNEITVDASDELQALSLTYVQHCEGGAPALRGTVEWRAGDTTGDPLWLGGSTPTTPPWTPPPDTDAAPGAPLYDAATAPAYTLGTTIAGSRDAAALRTAESGAENGEVPQACGSRGLGARPGPRGTRRADVLRGTRRGDLVFAGAGADRVLSGAGDDCIDGGSGNDRIDGGTGSDVLLGGAGDDRLSGGAGDDVLIGGPGRDLLVCGRGRDRAVAGPGDRVRGCERITRTAARGRRART
jgi:Ca2+-binding RTX toxin-like protein